MDSLQVELGEELLSKLRSGKARASDLNVCRQFLKDNGYEQAPTQENPLSNLVDELPFDDEEEKTN